MWKYFHFLFIFFGIVGKTLLADICHILSLFFNSIGDHGPPYKAKQALLILPIFSPPDNYDCIWQSPEKAHHHLLSSEQNKELSTCTSGAIFT